MGKTRAAEKERNRKILVESLERKGAFTGIGRKYGLSCNRVREIVNREAATLAPEYFDKASRGGKDLLKKIRNPHYKEVLLNRLAYTSPGTVEWNGGEWNGGLTDETSGADRQPQSGGDEVKVSYLKSDNTWQDFSTDDRKVFILGWSHTDFSPGPDGERVFKPIGVYDDKELMLRIKRLLLEPCCDPACTIVLKEYVMNTEEVVSTWEWSADHAIK